MGGLNEHLLPEFSNKLEEEDDADDTEETEALRVGGDLSTSVTVQLRANIPKVLLPVGTLAGDSGLGPDGVAGVAEEARLLHLYCFNLTYARFGESCVYWTT